MGRAKTAPLLKIPTGECARIGAEGALPKSPLWIPSRAPAFEFTPSFTPKGNEFTFGPAKSAERKLICMLFRFRLCMFPNLLFYIVHFVLICSYSTSAPVAHALTLPVVWRGLWRTQSQWRIAWSHGKFGWLPVALLSIYINFFRLVCSGAGIRLAFVAVAGWRPRGAWSKHWSSRPFSPGTLLLGLVVVWLYSTLAGPLPAGHQARADRS